MLNYRPHGMQMWDTWHISVDGTVHMFHLQKLAAGSELTQADADRLGHAMSRDLLHWEEQPPALGQNTPGTLDDLQAWTGCIYAHDGTYYLYYTMRSSTDLAPAMVQRIGFATSTDLVHWERSAENPVIVPDARWYISLEHPLARAGAFQVDCRDLVIQPDPSGEGWFGFYAARVPGEELAETTAIACVHTHDLVHWEHRPPAFVPSNYACLEVPDVFPLNGRWYLTCLGGTGYGNRMPISDPYCGHGTIYAVADRPEGPYREIPGDNALLAGDSTTGYSCRTVMVNGERILFSTEPSLQDKDVLSPPRRLKTTEDGRLRVTYAPETQGWRQKTLLSPDMPQPEPNLIYPIAHWLIYSGRWQRDGDMYRGEARTGWQFCDLGVGAPDVEMEARLTVEDGQAAGLVYRAGASPNPIWTDGDLVFGLDAEAQTCFAADLPHFTKVHRRAFPVQTSTEYHIRVCVRSPRFDVFINDELVLQFAFILPELKAPSVGLYVERGQATIRDITVYELG